MKETVTIFSGITRWSITIGLKLDTADTTELVGLHALTAAGPNNQWQDVIDHI